MTHATDFLARHRATPGFIMPNAWDAGGALVLKAAGFEAIGTTSAGVAFSLGLPDYAAQNDRRAVSREAMLARLAEIVAATDMPVNGDLEAGYGDAPETVAETIAMAIEIGLAGANIEDKKPGPHGLYDETLAAERIQAAREAIDAAGVDFVLTARSDALLQGADDLEGTIRRSNRYRRAGADCLFTPGATEPQTIDRLVDEIEGPLNLVIGLGGATGDARDWIARGVRRVSTGGAIARAALALVRRAAEELRDEGGASFAAEQTPQAALNALFAARSA